MLSSKDLVDAHLYPDEQSVIQDALRHLMRTRPDLRIALAVHRYRTTGLSLAKAAEVAGVSWAQMREILLERGVSPRLGPDSADEARQEAEVLRQAFKAPR